LFLGDRIPRLQRSRFLRLSSRQSAWGGTKPVGTARRSLKTIILLTFKINLGRGRGKRVKVITIPRRSSSNYSQNKPWRNEGGKEKPPHARGVGVKILGDLFKAPVEELYGEM